MNKDQNVLFVDDEINVINTLRRQVRNEVYGKFFALSVDDAIPIIETNNISLIILDLQMPQKSGYDLLRLIKQNPATKDIPVIFLTSSVFSENEVRLFEAGASDYISKPFKTYELLARIRAQLNIKGMQDELILKNRMLQDREFHLQQLVNEKVKKIEQTTLTMVSALESANYYNDTDTGAHIKRVCKYSALLADLSGCDQVFVKRIELYASLHDIGKVAIPDSILKKADKLSEHEFEQMKKHVDIGSRMLANSAVDQMAGNIALYHHEMWDGGGYTHHLKEEEIPFEARIVAVADVYDALTSDRIYRKAMPVSKANDIIENKKATHFDPKLVELFLTHNCEFETNINLE